MTIERVWADTKARLHDPRPVFTDEQEQVAIDWIEGLGPGPAPRQTGWLGSFKAFLFDNGVPDDLHVCRVLAHHAVNFHRPRVLDAMGRSPVAYVVDSLAGNDGTGCQLAHWAVIHGDAAVIEAMVRIAHEPVQASLGAVDVSGNTPAHYLAGRADPKTAPGFRALLKSVHPAFVASLSMHNQEGQTPLHGAAQRGVEPVVEELAKSTNSDVIASLQALNSAGQTPADVALAHGHMRLARMLDPINLALVRAVAHLEDGDREARNLATELRCPVTWMPFTVDGTVDGDERPVRLRNVRLDGNAGPPMPQCYSAIAATNLRGRPCPITFQPFEGYAEAPDRVALARSVAEAYMSHPKEPAMAQALALQAYAPGAPRHYLDVMADPSPGPSPTRDALGPQPH